MQRYHTVLFDADNTLFDFDRAEHEALGRALRERGYPDDDATRETYLAINRELWRRFDLGEADQDWLLVERCRRFEAAMGGHHDPERFNRDYLTYLGEGAFLLPGAMELCRTLSERCTLAIVTNGATIAQTGRFARSGLAPYFKGLFISQELGCRKPERAYFDTVLSRLGVADRRDTVVVGDNLRSDIQGGINAGLDTIWYHPGGGGPEEEIGPTHTAEKYGQVAALILGEPA